MLTAEHECGLSSLIFVKFSTPIAKTKDNVSKTVRTVEEKSVRMSV